jgi:hypothetical protein
MIKKLLLMGGLAVALAFALVAGGQTPARANPSGLQDFNVDMTLCLVPGALTEENMDATNGAGIVIDIDSIDGLSWLSLPTTVKVDNETMTLTALTDAAQDTMTVTRTAAVVHLQPKSVYRDQDVSPDPLGALPMSCGDSEGRDVGPGGGSLSTAINLPAGDRLGYPYVYNGPGPVLQSNGEIADGTQIGDVVSVVDLNQDGGVDVMADSTNCGGPPNNCLGDPGDPDEQRDFSNAIPEQYIKEGLTFAAGTGCTKPGGLKDDETYLNSLMPGEDAMSKYVRYRACIDTVYVLGQYRVDVVATNGSPTPLNLVTLSPKWSPEGTHVNLVSLSQIADKASPSTGLLGLDSPQSSLAHTNAPYASNATDPGLYAQWITEISAADQQNGALNFVYSTSCKAIGGNQTDADSDCLAAGDDVADGNADQDGDGLLDGLEVAWGSCPNNTFVFTLVPDGFDYDCQYLNGVSGTARTMAEARDTDQDGRTDLEEMVGPTQFLSNPRAADTDGDGVVDGGLTLDVDGDGAPDCADEDGDGLCGVADDPDDTGMTVVSTETDGTSHVRVGYKIVGTDIKPAGAGGKDNCPSTDNAGQTNTDLDAATTWGHGDLYGDACDTDDDNDGIVDPAEQGFQYDSGMRQCSNDVDVYGAATPLLPLNADSDGDGVIDGVECEVGSNPYDAADSPGKQTPDEDKDGVSNAYETFKRTQNFSGTGDENVDGQDGIGQADPDSDGDTLSDGCEIYVTGTNPMRPDSDGNGTADASEPNLVDRIAQHCVPSTKTISPVTRTVEGPIPDVVADDVELTFTIPGGTTIGAVAAGGGNHTPACKWAAGVRVPSTNTWKVKWSSLCVAKDEWVQVQVNYTNGGTAPTLTQVCWTKGNGQIGDCETGSWDPFEGVGTTTDLDGDTVLNDVDNCPFVSNADQANTDPAIGNGKGVAGDDSTVPWSLKSDKRGDACDGDWDNDSISNVSDADPAGDITYDDNNDGTWQGTGDDGPSWDTNMDAKLDGVAACLSPLGAWGSQDADGDGLLNGWEFCKWASSPNKLDSDSDTKGDCTEVADVDGNNVVNFPGDVIFYAKAILLSPAAFGQDGDFDIDGNDTLNFPGDVIQEAKFGLIAGLCK